MYPPHLRFSSTRVRRVHGVLSPMCWLHRQVAVGNAQAGLGRLPRVAAAVEAPLHDGRAPCGWQREGTRGYERPPVPWASSCRLRERPGCRVQIGSGWVGGQRSGEQGGCRCHCCSLCSPLRHWGFARLGRVACVYMRRHVM